ncbi:hypothetical protein TNIN_494211 [Trichonephila inaurata madagascariensis]|uniref:Uncharacterized protein n=1 Tax=Trichonephila inaurata madagascariensis TaxID=2747483 RepID=A0A8X6YAI7_9ARAC|nr:hypothetical protein TNIN_393751 [Trichonephila inaurata madagascariensis]GFY73050.1 hypothetical protein TNIN_494211 [Trichonephila inaurata madagascariensis]
MVSTPYEEFEKWEWVQESYLLAQYSKVNRLNKKIEFNHFLECEKECFNKLDCFSDGKKLYTDSCTIHKSPSLLAHLDSTSVIYNEFVTQQFLNLESG